MESQEQAFHPSPQPLGNLAKSERDFHIPTAPATRLMEKWKTQNSFPLSHSHRFTLTLNEGKERAAAAFALRRMKLEMQWPAAAESELFTYLLTM